MADLTRIDASGTVEITDGISQSAAVKTTTPSASDGGLVVREAQRGQQTAANSIPVVMASNQSPIPITVSSSGSSSDGTGRLRTSALYRIFQYDFSQGDNRVFWDTSTATGGTSTFVANENAMSLNTTTSNGSEVIRQTKQRFFNQTGLTHTYVFGVLLNATKTNLRQRFGCFDSQDGIYFEQSGGTINVVQRTFASGAAVNTSVAQASWNLDMLDGTGASGITLDFTKINTYFIEYSWVGSGRARLGVIINGTPIYCHEFLNDNILITPFISRSTLPVRLELTNTAATGSGSTMKYYGVGVFSDSGQDPVGMTRAITNPIVGTAISNVAYTPVLSLRLKSANARAVIRLLNLSLAHTSTAVVSWRVILNGSLTAPAWTDVTGTNTITQQDTAASAVTGGDILFSGNYVGGSGGYSNVDLKNPINLSSNIAGTADIVTLACERIGGVTTSFVSITYMELS